MGMQVGEGRFDPINMVVYCTTNYQMLCLLKNARI